ncbi:MAG: F0F1 ATP synthase subunit gamma, partial [Clostridiales bacterium]|nr:F0F1 ATP synthase subunit gamma [Clostridiales bacterium]
VVANVVKSWLSGFIYSALVDSFCSEQSARMTAMSSANKNAEKILESLTAAYNRLRQAAITQEITEVTAGAKAQKKKRSKEVLNP